MLDSALFTEIGENEVSASVPESVTGVEGVTSTPACLERRPEEVKETSLLPGAL